MDSSPAQELFFDPFTNSISVTEWDVSVQDDVPVEDFFDGLRAGDWITIDNTAAGANDGIYEITEVSTVYDWIQVADRNLILGFFQGLQPGDRITVSSGGVEDSRYAITGLSQMDSSITVRPITPVEADGLINVTSTVTNRPNYTSDTTVQPDKPTEVDAKDYDPKKEKAKPRKNAAALAIPIGFLINHADAYIAGDADVNAVGALTVQANAINQIDPTKLWGYNLIAPDTSNQPDFTSSDGQQTANVQTLKANKMVQVASGHPAGKGEAGDFYSYVGPDGASIDLSTEDYTSKLRWKQVYPAQRGLQSRMKKFSSYMNGNLGLDANLVDAWSQAVAAGQQKTSFAAAITVLSIDQHADARIKNGAKINQTLTSSTQDVTVDANSVSHLISLGGNFMTPSFTSVTGMTSGAADTSKWTSGDTGFKKNLQATGTGGADTESAIGVSVLVHLLTNDVTAMIENGVTLEGEGIHLYDLFPPSLGP
jgi:hypothetical protein